MRRLSPTPLLHRIAILAAILLLAGCAIAQPRTDDPWQNFNRKTFALNQSLDKAVIRPVAVSYRKITTPPIRSAVSDFFTNLRMPITIANDLLQARPEAALRASGRFLVNLTLGVGGLFDPASGIGLPLEKTDFGVTLARWGVPDGPYLVLPLFGPTTARDFWRIPVDGYLFDPLSYYESEHQLQLHAQLLPQFLYLVNLRASAIDAESFLRSAYDPYVFIRDAYRQRRLYKIYLGNPPAAVIERMQGLDEQGFDPEQLLQEQHQWEQKNSADQPAPASSVPTP
ncbi:MAG: VacJ family lipoprotein [Xanthomonadales bacterium]|nr:VacJ family lipoprotein [Xanthomonadales bacterium]